MIGVDKFVVAWADHFVAPPQLVVVFAWAENLVERSSLVSMMGFATDGKGG
jgi:hypothetical protein